MEDIVKKQQEELRLEKEKMLVERKKQWFNYQGESFASIGNTLSNNYLDPYDDNLLYSGHSSDRIKKALETIINSGVDRSSSLKTIRDFSRYLFATDDAYGTSILDFVGSILWTDILKPLFNPIEMRDKYEQNKDIIRGYLDNAFDKGTLQYIVLNLIINGVYFGYETGQTDNALIQHLPVDYCKLLGRVNGHYEIAFDFSYFDSQHESLINYYPRYFQSAYNLYKEDKKERWQTLKWEKTFVFTLPMELPLFARSFKNILLKYKSDAFLEEGLGSEQIKFIIQKIPLDKETGDLLADVNVAEKFHNAIVKKMPKNVVVITSPFDTKPEAYTENKMSTTSDKRDYINNQVMKSVGLSEANLGISKAQSGYKIYIRALESKLNAILPQIGHRISYQISNIQHKQIHKSLNWKYSILPITTQNREEWFKNTFDLYKEGGSIALPYQIATGLPLDDIKSMLMVEKVEDFNSYLHTKENDSNEYEPKGGKEATTDEGESSKDRDLKDEM